MQFGQWTVIEFGGRKSLVRCSCGTERAVQTYSLKSGKSTNCGCAQGRPRPAGYRQRGSKRVAAHPLYNLYQTMKRRCDSPNHEHYDRYGGRGIRVCDRWLFGDGQLSGFECFVADVGERPPKHTLDRRDNDGNYEPGNIRWATQEEQMANSSLVLARGLGSLSALARRMNATPEVIMARARRGLRGAELEAPVIARAPLVPEQIRDEICRLYVCGDMIVGARPLARKFGISERTVRRIADAAR